MISPTVKDARKKVLTSITELKSKINIYEKDIKISPSLVSDIKVINDNIDLIDIAIDDLRRWKSSLKIEAEKFIGIVKQGKKTSKKVKQSTKAKPRKSSIQTQKDDKEISELDDEIKRLRKKKVK